MTLTTLLDSTIDRIGDRNPQLFRELKGRLTPRTLMLTVGLVVAAYLMVYFLLLNAQPVNVVMTSEYCQIPADLKPATLDPNAVCPIEWHNVLSWWTTMNGTLFLWVSMGIMFGLIGAGTYLLVHDLAQEKRHGTLNFILFSPQPTRTILWGKLLGVPSVLYVAIAVSFPFHLWYGLQAQIALTSILGFYLALALITSVFFHIALLIITLSPTITGLEASLTGSISVVILAFLHYNTTHSSLILLPRWLKLFCPSVTLPIALHRQGIHDYQNVLFNDDFLAAWQWFGLPIGQSEFLMLGLIILNAGLCLYWLDRALIRRFRNPNTTMWSKPQAYSVMACLNVLWLGFCLPLPEGMEPRHIVDQITLWLIFMGIMMLIVIAATFPQRQSLIDWTRYRHELKHRRSLLWDFLIGENSPNVVVVLILGNVMVLLPTLSYIWIESDYHHRYTMEQNLIVAVLVALWLLAYTVICYTIILRHTPFKNPLQVNVLLFFVTCPLTMAAGLTLVGVLSDQWWSQEVYLTLLIGFESVALLLGTLTLDRTLRFWGRSDMKATLDAPPAYPRPRDRFKIR